MRPPGHVRETPDTVTVGAAHRSAARAWGARPVPFRTRKLSPIAPRVLRGQPVGGQGAADRWTAKPLLESGSLVIFKAFTKLYGMAGVRLGYCLCGDEALLEKMQAAGQPWAVSSLAQAAGIAALKETAYVDEVRALIAQQRPAMTAGLRALGLRVIDGKANYLLFRAPADLNERLRPLGTQVRSCANYPGLGPEWYRTAVRTAPENARLLEIMREVLE